MLLMDRILEKLILANMYEGVIYDLKNKQNVT
jgi:hypothetical protein